MSTPPNASSNDMDTTGSAGSSSTSGGVNAFEWLAGGLFFGNNNNSDERKHKRELQNISNSKDVTALWTGVQENLQQLRQESQVQTNDPQQQQQAETPLHATASEESTAMQEDAPESAATTAPQLTASDFLSARLSRLRFLLYEERKATSSAGASGFRLHHNTTPHVAIATVQFFASFPQFWATWITGQPVVPFESRKVLTHIFCYLTVAGLDGPDAEYYQDAVMQVFVQQVLQPQFDPLLSALVAGYASSQTDICLHCGSLYRALLRHTVLYQQLVTTSESVEKYVFPFLDQWVHSPLFDVSSDALECVRAVLTPTVPEMAPLAAQWMTRDYEALWDQRFVPKLLQGNVTVPTNETQNDSNSATTSTTNKPTQKPNNHYMTQRVALQILSTVLLTRTNYNVMVQFVASAHNLKVVLLLLRHTSPHITLDAFHVFKVFVANPNKPPEVIQMLKQNQVKLAAYLKTLHTDKAQANVQFRDEKALIIATIEAL